MWQEARKQEKLIRGMMVDYKRRAERRKGFYDKIVSFEIKTKIYLNQFELIRKKIRHNFYKYGDAKLKFT